MSTLMDDVAEYERKAEERAKKEEAELLASVTPVRVPALSTRGTARTKSQY